MLSVVKRIQQFGRRLIDCAPYPLALQGLVSLVLLAAVPSALSETPNLLFSRIALLCLLIGIHILAAWLVPVRKLKFWWQLIYLALQVGLASLSYAIVPYPLIGYVYVAIVLQAIYLFRPLVWILFACSVYGLWSGSLMIASTNLFEWLYANLALAFPVTCILIAAVLYARQHHRHEQVQTELRQQQNRYEALLARLDDAEQDAALAERHRLAQTITSEISSALAQVEQSISHTIAQAQQNLVRIELPIEQTRAIAANALDHMRAAVSTLRHGLREDTPPETPNPPTLPPTELMTIRSQRTLTWVLPLVFTLIALPLMLLQETLSPLPVLLFILCSAVLLGGYVFTQRIHHPLLVRLGLTSQAAAVLGMVFATQTVPLMLGLLLVLWQMAMRLPVAQLITFLVGVPTLLGLAFTPIAPTSLIDSTTLLIFCLTCIAVGGLIATARSLLNRGKNAGEQLAQLTDVTSELEQQLQQTRALAVAVERTRLAREIHDDIGHRLVLLNLQLQLVEDLIIEDPEAALEQLCSTREQLREAWSSMISTTDAVLALTSDTLPAALERLINHCQSLTPITISLKINGDLSQIDQPTACTIYRAVQEGLTNMCKYANAKQAQVHIYGGEGAIQVRVRDDGDGNWHTSATEQVASGGQFGLMGLRERAELLGGELRAGPHPEGGFLLLMTLPATN